MKGDKNGVDQIAAFCAEAVREHGTDFDRVRQHVGSRLKGLTQRERAALVGDVRAAAEATDAIESGTRH